LAQSELENTELWNSGKEKEIYFDLVGYLIADNKIHTSFGRF
jgi:hypothetical protein